MVRMSKRKIVFNILSSYRVVKIVGEGAYGVVCLAIHKPTNTLVAIKKIEPFNNPLFCLRTLREIKLLSKFKSHENIVNIYDIQKPPDFNHFNEIYLIQQYMPSDLHHVIYSKVLSDDHIQYFIYQILRGIKFIHLAGVIHRDLKPANILVNNDCDVKICDFGLARLSASVNDDPFASTSKLTEYVTTRWYRAPEIMLTVSQYTTAVDLWSVGCILAELLIFKPLFPGKDYKHQLQLIFEFIGVPGVEDLAWIKSSRARSFIRSLCPSNSAFAPDPEIVLNSTPERIMRLGNQMINPQAIDLLKKLLIFDPRKRITVKQALTHPYVAKYHDVADEPTAKLISPEEFTFDTDQNKIMMSNLKVKLYNEILSFHEN